MAVENIPHAHFGKAEVVLVSHHVLAARSILRTVIFAVTALEAGNVSFGAEGGERWHLAVREAHEQLCAVRDVVTSSSREPQIDWFTPLALTEALDAALWGAVAERLGDKLDNDEIIAMTKVVIESLDAITVQLDEFVASQEKVCQPESA